jgi:5-methylcytosine-specific restriction enzyme subunit McrC
MTETKGAKSSIVIKNLYYMLSYAFQNLDSDQYQDLATEEFDNVHDLFTAILAKGIGRQLKQGLHREYVSHHEHLSMLRGKVDLVGTIRAKMGRRQELVCEYDELSENNLLNQILKTTALLLIRHGKVKAEHRDDLKKKLLYFSAVDVLEPMRIPWNAVRFSRNTQSYRMLITMCQLVFQGLLLTTEQGEHRLMSFLDEQAMSRLYEKFIFEYYVKECPSVRTSSPQIKWALDDDIGTMLPAMQSDIVLRSGKQILIIDAKYYASSTQQNYGVHRIHSSNLYQIFTYVKNKEAESGDADRTVSGMLLYARTDQEIQPDGVFHMSGNQISVKTLDLGQPFAEIAHQLDVIVDDHFIQSN